MNFDLLCKEKHAEYQRVIRIVDLLCKEKLSIEWNVRHIFRRCVLFIGNL